MNNRMSFFESRRANGTRPAQPAGNHSGNDTVMQTVGEGAEFRIEAVPPRWRLDDLILSDETRDEICEAADTVVTAPTVDTWLGDEDRRVAVNFYGRPGCGKTSSTDALACLLSIDKILRVNYADLESRFVGETPKRIRLAFRQAREERALLAFDEADSLLSRRFTRLNQANEVYINLTRSVVCMELDTFEGVVVFTTNLQENYDHAFVRRIASHVRFTLPDEKLRVRLWEKYLPATLPRTADVVLERLAELTEGFSPADIAIARRRAAVRAARRKGEQQRVCMDDLLVCVQKVKRAKEEVGSTTQSSPVRVEEREITGHEIPSELRDGGCC